MTKKSNPTVVAADERSMSVALPAALAAVQLVDGPDAAATGGVSLSKWHSEVAAGRAPAPVIREHRFTRWRAADVIAYWEQRAANGTSTRASALVADQARKASAAAQAKRSASAAQPVA